MNTCKTCKWWARNYMNKVGGCESGAIGCHHRLMGGRDPETAKPGQAMPAVDSGCDCPSFILTTADFGCIHHEPKAKERTT